LRIAEGFSPGDRLARFVHNLRSAGLPSPIRYLEIGAFEGQSMTLVHAIFNGAIQATAIDPFSVYPQMDAVWQNVQERFETNCKTVGLDVRLLVGTSVEHLPQLILASERFDLIYIDGSHTILDVLSDAALAWKLLAPGGLMVFDDYWERRPEIGCRPKLAVDAFVGAMGHEIEVVDVAGQVFLKRRLARTGLG
jgi:hypothetical protein